MSDSKDRMLISAKGIACRLPKIIIERAKELYSTVHNVNISRGRRPVGRPEGLMAACMWHACKDLDVPRSTKEIAHIFEIKLHDMTRGVKYFRENWRLANKSHDHICLETSDASAGDRSLKATYVAKWDLEKKVAKWKAEWEAEQPIESAADRSLRATYVAKWDLEKKVAKWKAEWEAEQPIESDTSTQYVP